MTKESSYELLQVKKWRAITYNWDILSTYGNQANLYCLTDFQVAWLLSNTQYMRWQTRWENCPCTEEDLTAMAAEMEYNLMNCFDTRWMGDLQYMFDREQGRQLDELELAFDVDGIEGINPDTPTDYYSGDDSEDRINALCMACDTYIRSYLNQFVQKASQNVEGLLVVGIFINLVPFIGTIAGVILAGLAYMQQSYINACNDDAAIDNVVCCMYNALIGQAVNQANFEDSLNACSLAGNSELIREIIASDLIQDKNWYSFLNALGDSFVILEAGATYTCPCSEETWEYTVDFDDLPSEASITYGSISSSTFFGQFVVERFRARMDFAFSGTVNITHIECSGNCTTGGNARGLFVVNTTSGATVIVQDTSTTPGTRHVDWDGDINVTNFYIVEDGSTGGAGCNIPNMTMKFEGTGVNPFT